MKKTIVLILGLFLLPGQVPLNANPSEYAPLDVTPFREIRDIDPKIVALRTLGRFDGPQPEGLKSENLAVSYSPGRAIVTHTIIGVADDSIADLRFRLDLRLTQGKWQLVSAGRQQRCRRSRDNRWRKDLCP